MKFWIIAGPVLFVVAGLAFTVLPPSAPEIAAKVGGWISLLAFVAIIVLLFRAWYIGAWRTKTWHGGGASGETPRPDGLIEAPSWYEGSARQMQGEVEHAKDLRAAALREAKRKIAEEISR